MALRLLGPLLQILCLVLLFQLGDPDTTWLGFTARDWCYGGFLLGLLCVVLGLFLNAGRRTTNRHD